MALLAAQQRVEVSALTKDEMATVRRAVRLLPADQLHQSLKLLRGDAEQILPTINNAIDMVSSAIDRRIIREVLHPENLPQDDMDIDIVRSVKADYYTQPRAIGRGAIRIGNTLPLPDLDRLLTDLFGKRPPVRLHDIEERDLSRTAEFIGNFDDFLATMFWSEIDSITEREQDIGGAERFQIMAHNSDQKAKAYLTQFGKRKGHLIHSLRAKDSNNRWAYYHIFVDQNKETSFLDSISVENGDIDLLDFGHVVFSIYEDEFRRQQKHRAQIAFSGMITKYKSIQERARHRYVTGHNQLSVGWAAAALSLLPGVVAGAIGASTRKMAHSQFNLALSDEGARSDLIRLLTEFRPLRTPTPTDLNETPDVDVFTHWVSDEVAASVITLAEQRHFTLEQVCAIAKLLTVPATAELRGMLDYLREVTWRKGGWDEALTYINSFYKDGNAREFDESPSTKLKGAFDGLIPFEGRAYPRENIYVAMLLALFSTPLSASINHIVERAKDYALRAAGEQDDSAIEFLVGELGLVRDRLYQKKPTIFPGEVEPGDIRRAFRIEDDILRITLSHPAPDPRHDTILEIFNSRSILDFFSLSAFGIYINDLEQSHRLRLLRGLIGRSLEPIFDKVGLPAAERNPFVDEIAHRLIWHKPKTALGPMPTAEELEAAGRLYSQVYKADRSIDIIKHLRNPKGWMPWIEAGTLTLPELRNRDFAGYKSLMAWRSKPGNDIKDALGGYDIPSKSDIIDQQLEQAKVGKSGERPLHLEWVLEKRAAKARKDRQSRDSG